MYIYIYTYTCVAQRSDYAAVGGALSLSLSSHTHTHSLSIFFLSLFHTERDFFVSFSISFPLSLSPTHTYGLASREEVKARQLIALRYRNTLQHTATHFNALQHTATTRQVIELPFTLSLSLSHTLSLAHSLTHTHTQGLASRNEVIERQLVELKATYKEERADMEVRYQKDMKEYRAEAEHRCISRVLQPVVVCCSVLQCVVVCCSVCVLRCVCPVLQCGAVRCRVCVQWRRSRVLQFVAVCVPRSISIVSGMYPIATHIVSHIAYSSALHKGHGRVSRRGRAPVHLSCVAACCCVLLCVDERVSC